MNQYIDQTILLPIKNDQHYRTFYKEALEYNFFSICIPPFKIKSAAQIFKDSPTKICSVIGFPNGHHQSQVKAFEAEQALASGCDELDMVANLSMIKSHRWQNIEDEIKLIKKISKTHILKVIVESSLLETEEIIHCCKVIKNAGADFIKTSTGFHGPGAKKEHIQIMVNELKNTQVKIKASGGIRDLQTAESFIDLGCSRIGTSSGVKIMQEYSGKK